MDTNTGQILTADEVKAELEKAMALSAKMGDFADLEKGGVPRQRIARTETMPPKRSPEHVMSLDAAIQKYLSHVKPLKRLPGKKCNHCYGVGHLGKDLTTGKFIPCSCTQ